MCHSSHAAPRVLLEHSQNSFLNVHANVHSCTSISSSLQHRSSFPQTSDTSQKDVAIGMSFASRKSFCVKTSGGVSIFSSYTVRDNHIGVFFCTIFRQLIALNIVLSNARTVRHAERVKSRKQQM